MRLRMCMPFANVRGQTCAAISYVHMSLLTLPSCLGVADAFGSCRQPPNIYSKLCSEGMTTLTWLCRAVGLRLPSQSKSQTCCQARARVRLVMSFSRGTAVRIVRR